MKPQFINFMRQPGVLLQLQHEKDQGGLESSWKLGTMKKVFPDHLAYVPRYLSVLPDTYEQPCCP